VRFKKTAESIEAEILSCLEEGPKSISELKVGVKSNWVTVEKFLVKLSGEKKVKEMISMDKKKVYQLAENDTYFEIPISKVERDKFCSLYALILEQYKSEKKIPTKTEFAKVAVEVIGGSKELEELPTIWYLYGMIPLMAAEPSREYVCDVSFEDEIGIRKLILKSINEKRGKSASVIAREQHQKLGETFYVCGDDFMDTTKSTKYDWDEGKILKSLNGMYLNCPIDDEFDVFELFDKFSSTVRKLFLLKIKPEIYQREIILTFDSLWKYFSTYNAYKSVKKLKLFKNPSDIKRFYMGNMLESREISLKENLSNLYSIYLNNLGEDFELEISKDASDIRNILEDLY